MGILARELGAGRITMDDTLDMAAGIYLHKKVGDEVSEGDVLATLYSAKPEALSEGNKRMEEIVKISSEVVHVEPLIIDEVFHGL